ncbi:DUF1284 domain-containing protein [Caldicellulosiruptoraceae bacterium PP1]
MDIRAHHLLCFLGFRGLGYSREFVEHFKKIYNYVYDENGKIKLLNSPDEICKLCPNLEKDKCKSEEKILNMDKLVLSFIKEYINIDNEVYPSQCYKAISKMPFEYYKKICSNCEWFSLGFCEEGFINLKNKYKEEPEVNYDK